MVNERCYKDAFSPEEAFHKIRSQFEKIAIVKLYTDGSEENTKIEIVCLTAELREKRHAKNLCVPFF